MKKHISFLLAFVLIISSVITASTAHVTAEGAVVYVSPDGVIDGVTQTVHTTFAAALSALGAGGGTIYLEGTAALPTAPNVSAYAGKTVNIYGYNNSPEGNILEFANATKSFVPTGAVNWVFDYVTIKHQDGNTTEDWIHPNGGTITFGENCDYADGWRPDKSIYLKMHIGSYYSANGGTVNMNSPVVDYVDIGSIAGYVSGTQSSFTTNGDTVYNFNAGIVQNVYGGMRNGTTGFATLNGDVYYNFNGAKLSSGKKLCIGSVKNGVVNGNIFFTFNGGEISRTLTLGSSSAPTDGYFGYGNTIVTVNGKNVASDSKKMALTISDGSIIEGKVGDVFIIVNNSDKLSTDTVTLSNATPDYYITTVDGTVTPVFEKSTGGNIGAFLGFDIKSDTEGLVPTLNGEVLTRGTNGYYTIKKSATEQKISFEAYEATLDGDIVYVSADGVIDGVTEKVYTTVADAISAIGKDGGTVFVEGTVVLPAKIGTSAITNGSLNFFGYKNSASGNIVEFANAATCFEPTTSVDITFDNITLKRQDGKTNEAWIASNGGKLTFGSGCLYKDGTRSTDSSALKLYIGAFYTKNSSKIAFNAPTAEYAEVGSLGGWSSTTSSLYTTNGDFVYDFNSGIFKNIYAGLRNGTQGFATVNGDIYYNFNGGTYTTGKIYTGNHKDGIINGNVIFTFNGGNNTRPIVFGGSGAIDEGYVKLGNAAVIINADKITESGTNFKVSVEDGYNTESQGKNFLVINHAEKLVNSANASVTVKSNNISYYITAEGGAVTPVFEKSTGGNIGALLGFSAVSDTEGEVPAIDGKMLKKNASGNYIIEESADVQKVYFATKAQLVSDITFLESEETEEKTLEVSNGDTIVLPECTYTSADGKVFGGWLDESGNLYHALEEYTVSGDMVFTAVYTEKKNINYFYVSQDGNDKNSGLTPTLAFKSVSAAIEAVNECAKAFAYIHIVDEAAYPEKVYTKNITFKYGILTNNTLSLCGSTVFDNVTLSATEIYSNGYDITFTENVLTNESTILTAEGELVKASLCGGDFAKVSLSDSKDIAIEIDGADIKELSFGTSADKNAFGVSLSYISGNVGSITYGEKAPSGYVMLLTTDENIEFTKDNFDCSVKNVKNPTDIKATVLAGGGILVPEGEYLYASGDSAYYYAVDSVINVDLGNYTLRKAMGNGKDYVHYPASCDGLYFKEFSDNGEGKLDLIYTAEKYIAPYYVSQNGDDENAGTSAASPKKTMANAMEKAGLDNDIRIIVMDTIFWNEDSSVSNIPSHSGTLYIEGLSEENIENQIIDYSKDSSENAKAGSVRLMGDTVFKNLSFKAHHYKNMYTNGFSLTFEGKIGYIRGTSGSDKLLLAAGRYGSTTENENITLNADMQIGKLLVGHNASSSVTGKATVTVNGAAVDRMYICGEGAKLHDVDIVYISGSISRIYTDSSKAAGAISGDIRIINGNGAQLVLDNAANITIGGNIYYYNCAEGISIVPVRDEKIFKLLTDVTVKAQSTDNDGEYISSKGGYFGLPLGSYNISAYGTDVYTNDGSEIKILSETSLAFNDYLYKETPENENMVFTGWCYKNSSEGPSSSDILPVGTVLSARYCEYDPESEEFGVFGVQIRKKDKGLRFIVDKKNTFSEKFTVAEKGAVIMPTAYLDGEELVKGGSYSYNGSTYQSKYIEAKKLFSQTDTLEQYTLCLTKTAVENYGRKYTVRAYAKCITSNGDEYMIYSAPVSSSLVKVVRQNVPTQEDKALFEEIVTDWENTYFGGGTTAVTGNPYANTYKVDATGVTVREIEIESGNDLGTPVKIAMITDSHLGKANHDTALINAMECAKFSDKIVLCGDNVESASSSAHMNLINDIVFKPYPDAVAVLGNHEYFYPGSGTFDDVKKKVDELWPHDPDYHSEVINGKVLIISIDNARQTAYGESKYYFSDEKAALVKQDLAFAREKGYDVLVFCHVPLASLDTTLGSTKETKELITGSADIVKAIFSGHSHLDKVYSIAGSYIDKDGNTVSTSIPYYNLEACPEDDFLGNVLFINVK